MLDMLVHPVKASPPIDVTVYGILTYGKLLQKQNIAYSNTVTVSGIYTLIKFVQFSNALCPMLVTD